jgi:hypothetical protein
MMGKLHKSEAWKQSDPDRLGALQVESSKCGVCSDFHR